MRALTFLMIAGLVVAPGAGAQQILEIDYSVGRTIIQDEWRAMRHHNLGADWNRNLLYVHDNEEPDGIMVFSLETGEWVRTISTPRGEGPLEIPPLGTTWMSLAGDGGLYVAGFQRVLMFDSNHNPVDMRTDMARIPVRVRGDSVLVFQQDQGETEDGRPHLFMGSANKASLHPLRRVSGEPCEGMAIP